MDKRKFQQVLRRAFWIPFGIAAIVAVILIGVVHFLVERTSEVQHSDYVISLAQGIYRNRIDQETGLRAYLLTSDKRFLSTFYDAGQQALEKELQLRQLISNDPEEIANDEKAVEASRAWSAWAEEVIALDKAGEDTADVAFQLRGKQLMDAYREARTDFLDRQQQLRDERLAQSRRALHIVNGSVIALCLVIAAALALLARKQMRNLSGAFNKSLRMAEVNALEARTQKERLAGIIDSAMDAVITLDASQRILVFNRTAEEIFRCPASEAIGEPLDKFVPERFRKAHRHHVEGFGHTGVTNRSMSRPGTLWGLRADGTEFPIEATISQVENDGQKLFTVILRDIGERLATEKALREAEGFAASGRMAATLAHEINNPLAAIVNLAYMLRTDPALPGGVQPLAEMLDQELRRVSHIVRQTLGLYHQHPTPLMVRLTGVVDDVLDLYREELRGITVKKRYDFDGFLTGSPTELHQLVSNLVLNAVEAVVDGNGSILLHIAQSCDWRDPERRGIRLVIADSGVGIPADARTRIFQPFFTTKQEKGTGLGLAIVQWVAARHGGSVRVRSSTRHGRSGTCVSVFLKSEAAGKKAPTPAPVACRAQSQAS